MNAVGSHRDEDDNPSKTDARKEWAAWSSHGYRKLYQPRSILRISLVPGVLLIADLFMVFWLAAHRRLS